jgi:hypothetical protein
MMFTGFYRKKAQSTAEYAIVIGLVIASILGMQTYVKRGLQGRTHDASKQLYDTFTSDPNWSNISSVSDATAKQGIVEGQYEVDKIKSQMTQVITDQKETEDIKTGGTVERTFTQGSSQAPLDYQEYGYTK